MPTRADAEAPRAPRATSPEGALAAYLAHLKARRYSPETIATRRMTLTRFCRHLRRRRLGDLRRVDESHLVSYAHRLSKAKTRYGRPSTPLTQRTTLGNVRGLFAFLMKKRLILRDPARDVQLPRIQHLPGKVLSEAQARRLLAAPHPSSRFGQRDRAVLELLYGSGLRAGELRRLNLTDLDLEKATLLVRDGKGRKDRVVPLSGRSVVALAIYLKDARPLFARRPHELALFLSQYGRRLSRSHLQHLVAAHARASKAPPGTSAHSLRHACATHLLQGGANIRHVQAILGHRWLDTTAVYTKVQVKDLARVLERSHPRERAWMRQRRSNGRL